MTIQTIERLVGELTSAPAQPLTAEQKDHVYAFAAGLFMGHIDDMHCQSPYSLTEMQALRALAHKQSFYIDYFHASAQGEQDLITLGIAKEASTEEIQKRLLNTNDITRTVSAEDRKNIASRSAEWAKNAIATQLHQNAATDDAFTLPARQTVNYNPDALLEKAASVHDYRVFYARVSESLAAEPDALLAHAKRAVLELHVGRLHAMAAVDVFPGLLSLEDQLTRSEPSAQVTTWLRELARVAPAIGALHDFSDEARSAARESYARHLDAIRQGAAFELGDVSNKETALFLQQALSDLTDAIELSEGEPSLQKTALGAELETVRWRALDIQRFVESLLARWDMLSAQRVTWSDVDQRQGFAPDEKFQVIITPHRKNMSVDSTRRVINIPATIERPLAGLYPAGALPLIAHELTHVLQAFADYDLGQRIPLARMKGRRYRILREAGGVYQEYVLARDYFGTNREPNNHYIRAYQAKLSGAGRVAVARVFYESLVAGKGLSAEEDAAARDLAVNRTSRLYRYGGHSSQVLDYVEQSVVCNVLLQRLMPEQVNAFLLGGSSFSLEDSARLHKFGLFALPDGPVRSPAEEVIQLFLNKIY